MVSATGQASDANSRPNDIGIVGLEVYFPSTFVEQSELEKFDGVSAGKYTIGLGQTRMAFCDDREDINSICLTVVKSLMDKYNLSYLDVGRLEVGTETIIDKSKSVKSVIMELFQRQGNTDIEGIDTTNACYGGTNALLNSINWMESSSWDGRYAIVVAGDIAVYASGNARPTGGCGVVAMLIGPDAPLVFDAGLRGSHMENVYDFYKPELASEYPEVDGPLTIECYFRALDKCYARYSEKMAKKLGVENPSLENFDYLCFHSPYTKLVQKSFGRLAFNDFLRNPKDPKFSEELQQFKDLKLEETYFNREIEKAFIQQVKPEFSSKVEPSLLMAKNVGNMYCGSLYSCLVSLISQVPSSNLVGKRIALFSYGSGLASTLFSLKVVAPVDQIVKKVNLIERLNARTSVDPAAFEKCMALREETHNLKDYKPVGKVEKLLPGTYYLANVDSKFRREYGFKSTTEMRAAAV